MSRRARLFAGLAALVVAITTVAAFIVIGSPWEIRRERLDAQRIADLQRLSAAIESYHRAHGRLPEQLADLEREPRHFVDIRDPVSGEAYDYIAGEDEMTYRLCARFETDSDRGVPRTGRDSAHFWRHEPGRVCYAFTVTQAR